MKKTAAYALRIVVIVIPSPVEMASAQMGKPAQTVLVTVMSVFQSAETVSVTLTKTA